MLNNIIVVFLIKCFVYITSSIKKFFSLGRAFKLAEKNNYHPKFIRRVIFRKDCPSALTIELLKRSLWDYELIKEFISRKQTSIDFCFRLIDIDEISKYKNRFKIIIFAREDYPFKKIFDYIQSLGGVESPEGIYFIGCLILQGRDPQEDYEDELRRIENSKRKPVLYLVK